MAHELEILPTRQEILLIIQGLFEAVCDNNTSETNAMHLDISPHLQGEIQPHPGMLQIILLKETENSQGRHLHFCRPQENCD